MQSKLIIENLKKSKLRITPARKKIIELFETKSFPLSVGEILKHVKVNKTTVYRELQTLIKYKHITEINFNDGIKRYELLTDNHHHHLICIRCKSIKDYTLSDDFTKEEKEIMKKEKFKTINHNLDFFGICHNCK